jgi:hypothetical protein
VPQPRLPPIAAAVSHRRDVAKPGLLEQG